MSKSQQNKESYKGFLKCCVLLIFDHSQLKSSFGPFSDLTLNLRIHIWQFYKTDLKICEGNADSGRNIMTLWTIPAGAYSLKEISQGDAKFKFLSS